MSNEELHSFILNLSEEIGFAAYGAVKVQRLTAERENLERYLNDSFHASMGYLARNLDLREDPSLLFEGAKSVLVFLFSYKPVRKSEPGLPVIASYAYGLDYHIFIKDRLKRVAEKIKAHRPLLKYRVFTDSAPVFERALAKLAGLGFIGKNTFLISKTAGLHTLIGTIFINEEVLFNDSIVKEGCGKCTKCIDACPTGAISSPYRLDSRRCISYQTIESKPEDSDKLIPIERDRYIFGCDICLKACPWSSRGGETTLNEFSPLKDSQGRDILSYTSEDWMNLNEEQFRMLFSNSPLARAGLDKIKMNVQQISNT
ncbi:MAG: tRNA epoxyqueuosine(34) reductase QueG [Bacteroidales bacterium]